MYFSRNKNNPIITPSSLTPWESFATFNASPIKDDTTYKLVYRAVSEEKEIQGHKMRLSTIGYAESTKKDSFPNRKQLITPTEDWETYGCEDPRITKIDNEYFVFYTALSEYPFRPSGIKIGVAVFSDVDKSPQKHLVTPFNAKAMTLFPEKINGKYVALLTVNTDIPPSTLALAWFDKKEDIWSQAYWTEWYQHLKDHAIPLKRINCDQLEVGTQPLKTEKGWLILYSHIQHYFDPSERLFGIEAAILDLNDPQKIIGRTEQALFAPLAEYEMKGIVPQIVFPSGALMEENEVQMYYGAADTTVCLASCSLDELFKSLRYKSPVVLKAERPLADPLLSPNPTHAWEAKASFNPAVFADNGDIHLLYRAMGFENTSVLGYAILDGISIKQRNEMPIYVPRASFETKKKAGQNSGCEDPRITKIGDTLYMCYTAYDGENPPRVALTSISLTDFFNNNFNWKDPVLISPPGIDDKDATIFPEKIDDKFVIAHRIQNEIVIDFVDNLEFDGKQWLRSLFYIPPVENSWDNEKIGISAPPIQTPHGWLALYHGVSKKGHTYRIGAMLLDLQNPEKVLARTPWPLLEPDVWYEKEGNVQNVVFPCGMIHKNNTLYIYYGGADKVVEVATLPYSELLEYLLDYPIE